LTYHRNDEDRRQVADRLERARRQRGQALPGSPEDEDARLDAAYLQRELRERTRHREWMHRSWSL